MLVQYLYRLASKSEGVSLAILPFVNIISVTSNQSKGAAQQISTASFNRNISLILPIRENNFLKQHSERILLFMLYFLCIQYFNTKKSKYWIHRDMGLINEC